MNILPAGGMEKKGVPYDFAFLLSTGLYALAVSGLSG